MDVICTNGLCKAYGGKTAVDHSDMHVRQGEIYGFIGRNGSGKSTTLKLLCGIAAPTGGEVRLFGKPVEDPSARRRLGVLVETPGIYSDKSGFENMMLKACCLGIVKPEALIGELLTMVGLKPSDRRKTKKYSMGMKQRLGIAMALLGGPDVLILDEPINGLDPEGMSKLRQILLNLNQKKGMTIIVSSHILGELEKIATCYGIIKDGRMVREITSEELIQKCKDYLCVQVDDAKGAAVILEEQLGIKNYEVHPDGELRIFDFSESTAVAFALAEGKIAVKSIYLHRQDLEDYFLELMGGKDND